jgi:hypothetical protein
MSTTQTESACSIPTSPVYVGRMGVYVLLLVRIVNIRCSEQVLSLQTCIWFNLTKVSIIIPKCVGAYTQCFVVFFYSYQHAQHSRKHSVDELFRQLTIVDTSLVSL